MRCPLLRSPGNRKMPVMISSREDRIPLLPPRTLRDIRIKQLVRRFLYPLTIFLRQRKISSFLAQTQEPKLHVGCGINILPGWLNTDQGTILNRRGVIYLDARKKLPFYNDTIHYVFSEHFITCLSMDETTNFIHESYRVLKPGGSLRIASVMWPFLAELYGNSGDRYERYVQWATNTFLKTRQNSSLLVLNNLLYGFGCKSIYDVPTLSAMLVTAGFAQIVRCNVGESSHSALRGVEGHGKVIPPEFNELETTVLEATKPVNANVG